MDLDKLNGTQIVLLTLLVSFVTSIATGIATVALVEQAPDKIKDPVFNVVERTVERVVTEEVEVPGRVVTTEKTVVVKEEDAVTESLDEARSRLARIYTINPTIPSNSDEIELLEYQGLGIVLGESGRILSVTPSLVVSNTTRYGAIIGDNDPVYISVVSHDRENGTILLDGPIAQPAVSVAEPSSIRLGQTMLGLWGESETRVATGIVTQVNPLTVDFATPETGMPIVNLFGELVAVVDGEGSLRLAAELTSI